MMTKYEIVAAFLIVLFEHIKNIYLRVFPGLAVIFGVLFSIGLAGGSDRGTIRRGDIPGIIIAALIYTISLLVYIIVMLRNREER